MKGGLEKKYSGKKMVVGHTFCRVFVSKCLIELQLFQIHLGWPPVWDCAAQAVLCWTCGPEVYPAPPLYHSAQCGGKVSQRSGLGWTPLGGVLRWHCAPVIDVFSCGIDFAFAICCCSRLILGSVMGVGWWVTITNFPTRLGISDVSPLSGIPGAFSLIPLFYISCSSA